MDQLVFPAIRITNINNETTVEILTDRLTRIFRARYGFFVLPENNVELYINGLEGSAIVRGIQLTLGEIMDVLQQKVIEGRPVVVEQDFGQERNQDGSVRYPLSGTNKLLLEKMYMHPKGCLESFFEEEFAAQIKGGLTCNTLSMLNLRELCDKDLRMAKKAGRIQSYKLRPRQGLLILDYRTALEKLQACSLLNNNPAFAVSGSFKDCAMTRRCGIGPEGKIMKVAELVAEDGYVPFGAFDQTIIADIPQPGDYYTKCYKCDNKGRLRLCGITPCLKYFAAKCSHCNYHDLTLDPLLQSVAVRFQDETFTRVIPERNDLQIWTGNEKAFNVIHNPLRIKYDSPKQAKDIVCQVVGHENFVNKTQFSLGNTTQGVLQRRPRHIEVLNPGAVKEESIYLLEVAAPKTLVWCPDNIQQFKHVTITFRGREKDTTYNVEERRNSKLTVMDIIDDGHVLLKLRLIMNTGFVFDIPQVLHMVPHCPETDYQAIKAICNDWFQEERNPRFSMLREILLGINNGFDLNPVPEGLLIIDQLNPGQQAAVRRCKAGRLAVVQGPPGTGKTFTAAKTILELAARENGLFLCVTKSNEAANNLFATIWKLILRQPHGRQYRERYRNLVAMRMFATKRERTYFRQAPHFNVQVPDDDLSLHQAIGRHPQFFRDEELLELFDKIAREGMDSLTENELSLFKDHVTSLRHCVLDQTQIIVTTLSAVADGRLQTFIAQKMKDPARRREDNIVNSILIDEAGVVPMPMVIPILSFQAKRYLFFGDQEQLCPQINCYSADAAGLNMSIMEYLKLGIAFTHPQIWQTLNVQYRMNADICSVISHMTYNDRLQCGVNIRTRMMDREVMQFRDRVHTAVPETSSSDVVVVQHSHYEEKSGTTSRRNPKEAKMVVTLTKRLTGAGVEQHRITIITTYEGQRQLIKEKLANSPDVSNIAVTNVDAFQGRENDIIILSLVRSNKRKNIGFCKTQNRMTVLVSRARHFEFFVGNLDMITDPEINEYHLSRLRSALAEFPRVKIELEDDESEELDDDQSVELENDE